MCVCVCFVNTRKHRSYTYIIHTHNTNTHSRTHAHITCTAALRLTCLVQGELCNDATMIILLLLLLRAGDVCVFSFPCPNNHPRLINVCTLGGHRRRWTVKNVCSLLVLHSRARLYSQRPDPRMCSRPPAVFFKSRDFVYRSLFFSRSF